MNKNCDCTGCQTKIWFQLLPQSIKKGSSRLCCISVGTIFRGKTTFYLLIFALTMGILYGVFSVKAAESDLRIGAANQYLDGEIHELSATDNTVWAVIDVTSTNDGTTKYKKLASFDKTLLTVGAYTQQPQVINYWRDNTSTIEGLSKNESDLYLGVRNANVMEIYRCSSDDPEHSDKITEVQDSISGYLESLYWDGSILWIGTHKGLYKWEGESQITREPDYLRGKVIKVIYKTDDILWIGTDENLYQKIGTAEPILVNNQVWGDGKKAIKEGTKIRTLQETSYQGKHLLWIGTDSGLYRYERSEGELKNPEKIIIDNKNPVLPIKSLLKLESSLLIGTQKGLFQIKGYDIPWMPKINFTQSPPKSINLNADEVIEGNINIKWEIEHYEWRTTPEQIQPRLILRGKTQPKSFNLQPGQFSCDVVEICKDALAEAGTYEIGIQAIDMNGISSDIKNIKWASFTVRSPKSEGIDAIIDILWKTGLLSFLLYTALAIALIIASRKSDKAFDFLTNPLMQKFNIYWQISLLYLTPVRIWIFERYYQKMRKRYIEENLERQKEIQGKVKRKNAYNAFFRDHKYIESTLVKPNEEKIPTSQLFKELKDCPHIHIVGKSGTGKTEMINELLRVYFSFPSLKDAWKHYDFIPIIVPVRDFASLEILKLAQTALETAGMSIEGDSFFKRLFTQGGFLLILDGLNEGDLDRHIKAYSRPQSVKLLMTSQTSLGNINIAQYSLSEFTQPLAEELLKSFLGEEDVETALSDLKEFLGEIKSGYEAKLLADLYRKNLPLPKERPQLYEQIIKHAFAKLSDYEKANIYEKAWHLVLNKERRFSEDSALTKDSIELLIPNVVIPRNPLYEFCHDQMRDYLAACYLEQNVEWQGKGDELRNKQIWQLRTQEQKSIFEFWADMIKDEIHMNVIAEFISSDLDARRRLLEALTMVARRKGWNLTLISSQKIFNLKEKAI